jgi:hypothetical protein
MKLFDIFLSIHGMLVCLAGQFVSGEIVTFPVGSRRGSVSVGCEVVEFGSSNMIALWHFHSP